MSGESQRNEKVPHLFGSMLTAMTLADDVGGRFGAGRKGQRCAAVGTGAVGGSHGEDRNESIKSKDRVHVYERNAIRKR